MPTGTLVHITAAKKLMIKISETTYDNLHGRLYNECKKKNYPTARLAVYSRENDDGEEDYFAMVALDEWDRQNMPKFKQLLRKDISFQTFMKPYDFMNDDNEQICGINLVLTSIRQIRKKIDFDEIDEIADKAAARFCSRETKLNAEEQAIDEDVEKQVDKCLGKKVRRSQVEKLEKELQQAREQAVEYEAWVKEQVADMIARCQKEMAEHGKVTLETRRDAERLMAEHMSAEDEHKLTCFWEKELPMAPPVLERQSAGSAATHRRRRVEPSEEMATGMPVAALAAADYQMPEEIKAFAIIDAFEQEE